MKQENAAEPSAVNSEIDSEIESKLTGLPWPKTWTGAYVFTIASFILWVGLLIWLTGCRA